MARVRDRALAIIELLASNAGGMLLKDVAETLDIPLSATHRVLADLKDAGYVRQDGGGERYLLTAKLLTLSATLVAAAGVTNLIQPSLDRLAETTRELVRVAAIVDDALVWVARSQGATQGLRFDPSDGTAINLAVTSTGLAWMLCLSDEQALQMVAREGLHPERFGVGTPHSLDEVMTRVRRARDVGYGMVVESSEPGTSAVSMPILSPILRRPVGVLNISGPSVRMTPQRMETFVAPMRKTADELEGVCAASPLFSTARGGDRNA